MQDQLLTYALEHFGSKPEYLFASSPDTCILRHAGNRKWYAIFMDVPAKKFGVTGDAGGAGDAARADAASGAGSASKAGGANGASSAGDELISVMNVKVDPDDSPALCMQADIFPGYHMNKKHWISILLDRSVPLPLIEELLEKSFELTA